MSIIKAALCSERSQFICSVRNIYMSITVFYFLFTLKQAEETCNYINVPSFLGYETAKKHFDVSSQAEAATIPAYQQFFSMLNVKAVNTSV